MKKTNKKPTTKTSHKNKLLILLTVISICTLSFFGYSYFKNSSNRKITLSNEDDFYVLSYNGITGFSYRDGQLQETSNNSFNLIEDGYNYVVHRARLQDRYLMFSEENRFGSEGRVISVDFQEGKVRRKKTPIYAFTSSGESKDYYFASESSYTETYLAVYSPTLELLDQFNFELPILGYDFTVDGNTIYMLGVPLENNDSYATWLYQFDIIDGKLNLIQSTPFDSSQTYTTYYTDSILVGDRLITASSAGRVASTGERDYNQYSIRIYDLTTGEMQIIPTESGNISGLYDLKNGYIAFDHMMSEPTNLSFTLLRLDDLSTQHIKLEAQPDPTGEEEYFKSICRLDDDRILVLTSKALWIYNIPGNGFESQHPLPEHINAPIEIWASAH